MTKGSPTSSIIALLTKAQQAYNDFAAEEAQSTIERALSMVDDQTDHLLLAQLHHLGGKAAFKQGRISEAEKHFDIAMNLYDEIGDHRHVVWCQIRIAYCSHKRDELRRAMHLASLALADARENGWDDLEAKALFTTANVAWKSGDREAALGDFGRAINIFKRFGMEDDLKNVESSMGFLLLIQNRYEEGMELLRSSLEYFRRIGDIPNTVKTLSNMAYYHFSTENLPEARELLLQACEIDEERHNPTITLSNWYNLGLVELHLKRFKEAKKRFIKTRQLCSEYEDPVSANLSLIYLGLIKLYESEPEEALNLFTLSYNNFTGSAADEVMLTIYYMAIGLILMNDIQGSHDYWSKRVPIDKLRDCMDDFMSMIAVLEFVTGKEYAPEYPLTEDSIKVVKDYLRRLKHEVGELN